MRPTSRFLYRAIRKISLKVQVPESQSPIDAVVLYYKSIFNQFNLSNTTLREIHLFMRTSLTFTRPLTLFITTSCGKI